jgi:uncharacterized membrane protein YeaQ/YmgE (transglycosylase-associated protein family)/uncharacterized protein YqgC (DUF456 family)
MYQKIHKSTLIAFGATHRIIIGVIGGMIGGMYFGTYEAGIVPKTLTGAVLGAAFFLVYTSPHWMRGRQVINLSRGVYSKGLIEGIIGGITGAIVGGFGRLVYGVIIGPIIGGVVAEIIEAQIDRFSKWVDKKVNSRLRGAFQAVFYGGIVGAFIGPLFISASTATGPILMAAVGWAAYGAFIGELIGLMFRILGWAARNSGLIE